MIIELLAMNKVIIKIMNYCAKTEHCTYDVISKLQEWTVPENEIETIVQKLYADKFIDDERYAKSYVDDKWNSDHWGKIKIENGLQQKQLDEKIIHEALQTINDAEYTKGLDELLRKKRNEFKTKNHKERSKCFWRGTTYRKVCFINI